ncbi:MULTISPECIES: IDEAL domain-containing protein [Bacillus]|uniref:IDEAL domain-containing protein n=1 Tax=Bacillus TaxID=1386 RepID=UPI0002D32B2D|nr:MULTISPECIES: IDEAL domain-containing protein [Bacillus]
MNHEQSYTEKMKSSAMHKHLGKETYMSELYVDMILQEALLKSEKEKLLLKIDEALDQRNEKLFYQYSKDLIALTKQFGT